MSSRGIVNTIGDGEGEPLTRQHVLRPFVIVPIQCLAAKFLMTMKESSPSQKAASFSLKQVMGKMVSPGAQ